MVEFDAEQFVAEYDTAEGKKLWALLNSDDVVGRMETATDLGQPALAPVEDILLGAMGEVITRDRFKQMAERMVRQIMEGRGFEHDVSGIRLNSVPLYKASRYRRRDQSGLYLFKSSAVPACSAWSPPERAKPCRPPKRGVGCTSTTFPQI